MAGILISSKFQFVKIFIRTFLDATAPPPPLLLILSTTLCFVVCTRCFVANKMSAEV